MSLNRRVLEISYRLMIRDSSVCLRLEKRMLMDYVCMTGSPFVTVGTQARKVHGITKYLSP
jgi:hypothetical protein